MSNRAAIDAAIGYYLQHRTAVEAHLPQRRRHADEVRRLNQARFPTPDIRERLLACREKAS